MELSPLLVFSLRPPPLCRRLPIGFPTDQPDVEFQSLRVEYHGRGRVIGLRFWNLFNSTARQPTEKSSLASYQYKGAAEAAIRNRTHSYSLLPDEGTSSRCEID